MKIGKHQNVKHHYLKLLLETDSHHHGMAEQNQLFSANITLIIMEQVTVFFLTLWGLMNTYTHDKYLIPVQLNLIEPTKIYPGLFHIISRC